MRRKIAFVILRHPRGNESPLVVAGGLFCFASKSCNSLSMHAMPLILGVLACLAIAYRFYSAFLAARVAVLDDALTTPAYQLNDGQNYHPTHKWVLFGHHFAAISGAGPLIGPVLAIQFGYLPGLIWIVVGVCLAGAVQDMLVLAASVRSEGRSLAEIARAEIGSFAGTTASITILFVVIVALSGLGVVVVKALGGEQSKFAQGTVVTFPAGASIEKRLDAEHQFLTVPRGSVIRYPNGAEITRNDTFELVQPQSPTAGKSWGLFTDNQVKLPAGVYEELPGSSWGTFTIVCTIPIALLVGLYMYVLRKGHVVEASLLGAIATLAATVAGNWIDDWGIAHWFELSREQTVFAICAYGFIASVLPVWLLLCPRDYLSSFLKIGTIGLLVVAVIVANPTLEAPAYNSVFADGGPNMPGAIFPFCFICIMCGAVSGFHALVSSGTTPKMIMKESHVRPIGYGAMLIEGLVGIVALIAAASLPQGDYWNININPERIDQFADDLKKLGVEGDNLAVLEQQVGGESLRGRTGGAVTLAVGMSQIMTSAFHRVLGAAADLSGFIKYWYHFAIMFEALFILTTIDTGTRIARFLLQEALGKIYKPFDRTDWLPGAVISTALVTIGWGALILTGSIDTIWPMFGIANQLLAVIALTVVTTWICNNGRRKYAPLTILPMLFVIATTATAGYQLVIRFAGAWQDGWATGNTYQLVQAGLNIGLIVYLIAAVIIIISAAVPKWMIKRTLAPNA
jgi:carbon starvation protein